MSDSEKNMKQSNACIKKTGKKLFGSNSYDISKEAPKKRRKLFSSCG